MTTSKRIKKSIVEKRKYIKSYITHKKPFKQLCKKINRQYGRGGSDGVVKNRHMSSGHKKIYRIIENYAQHNWEGTIKTIEYDPNRSTFISLIHTLDNKYLYVINALNCRINDTIKLIRDDNVTITSNGYMSILKNIPEGTKVFNIETSPNSNNYYARSAGVYCTIMSHNSINNQTLVKMPSKETRFLFSNCMCTIGMASNNLHNTFMKYKAGQSRLLGKRPHVRGVAMNPVSHPHGGGEGRTGTKRHPCSPTGVKAKGYKTVRKVNKFIVTKRSK